MDADYARLQWVWENEKHRLVGVSSGLAAAAKTSNLPLIGEWADKWDAQYEAVTRAWQELTAYQEKT